MKIAMIAPIAWRTPPEHYGPWERVTSLITEGLVQKGIDVTLFATANSQTAGRLRAVCPRGYEEDPEIDPKVYEYLHLSEVFEHAHEFDLIHNQFDFMALAYSRLVQTPLLTTIHGFSSPKILPVYEKYNDNTYYVSISDADRAPTLSYVATVYHGIDIENFTFNAEPEDYLIYFGRIHADKGTREAIEVAQKTGHRLIIAGIIQDQDYFNQWVRPHLDDDRIRYIGSVGPQKRDVLLRNARALLHPIHFNEPFGLSVVEAMACGTPVIAFPRGSMPEIIRHGYNGFLPRSLDEFIACVHDIDRIDRRHCRRTVEERFTQEIMVENYIRVYDTILKGGD